MDFADIVFLAVLKVQTAFGKHYHIVAKSPYALCDEPSDHEYKDDDNDKQNTAYGEYIEKELACGGA